MEMTSNLENVKNYTFYIKKNPHRVHKLQNYTELFNIFCQLNHNSNFFMLHHVYLRINNIQNHFICRSEVNLLPETFQTYQLSQ